MSPAASLLQAGKYGAIRLRYSLSLTHPCEAVWRSLSTPLVFRFPVNNKQAVELISFIRWIEGHCPFVSLTTRTSLPQLCSIALLSPYTLLKKLGAVCPGSHQPSHSCTAHVVATPDQCSPFQSRGGEHAEDGDFSLDVLMKQLNELSKLAQLPLKFIRRIDDLRYWRRPSESLSFSFFYHFLCLYPHYLPSSLMLAVCVLLLKNYFAARRKTGHHPALRAPGLSSLLSAFLCVPLVCSRKRSVSWR